MTDVGAAPLPLDGITVVALEQAVAAPLATRHLADLGARVVKVERPGAGDFARRYDTAVHGASSYFVWLNRSKESLTLDLKAPEAAEVLSAVLDGADVFVQNLAPGASGRLGLGAEALAASHPRLLVCDIRGYGSDGPWADRKAYDLLVQAEAGLMSITGAPEAPARVGISICDIAAGMYAYSAILAGLLARATSGVVRPIEISLLDALTEWMGSPLYYTAYGDAEPRRVGAEHATIAPYGPVATSDGAILLAVQNEREWAKLCEVVLGRPELASDERFDTNPRRVRHRGELNELIAERLALLGTAEAADLLDRAGVANARLNGVRDLLDHPALSTPDRWRDVATPGGPIRAFVPPGPTARGEVRMGAVPAVGEHTTAILTELGYPPSEVESLRARSVV